MWLVLLSVELYSQSHKAKHSKLGNWDFWGILERDFSEGTSIWVSKLSTGCSYQTRSDPLMGQTWMEQKGSRRASRRWLVPLLELGHLSSAPGHWDSCAPTLALQDLHWSSTTTLPQGSPDSIWITSPAWRLRPRPPQPAALSHRHIQEYCACVYNTECAFSEMLILMQKL